MSRRLSVPALSFSLLLTVSSFALSPRTRTDALEQGFRTPPASARPHIYYMVLNGYLDRAHAEKEIAEYARAGVGGLCVFDVGARGDPKALPPAGPPFLGPDSVADLAYIIRVAGRHGMEIDLSVASSWDMGGSWVTPEDASMTLVQSSLELEGGHSLEVVLPFPSVPPETPRNSSGLPLFAKDVAVLAIPDPARAVGNEFVFELRPPLPQEINRVVLHNNSVPEQGGTTHFAKGFAVSVSGASTRSGAFREVVRGTLEPRGGAQAFPFAATPARYVRLVILDGHDAASERVELAEFEVFSTQGEHVNPHWRATVRRDPAGLLRFTSARGQAGDWSAENIHDGVKEGPRGSWASGSSASLMIRNSRSVVDLTSRVDRQGRLRWDAPPGRWLIQRYVCVNTGEKLKVPSPNSDGLATDHLSAEATRRYVGEVIRRLKPAIGDFGKSGLKDLYLASYEIRGQIWTPGFLNEFRQRRGYDFGPFLPILSGSIVDGEEATERVLFDYRKTLGELLVDAYYRAAVETAHQSGLTVESEAGGPGPPLHQVPVDALMAQGAIDSVRGEFWPDRMNYNTIWVVKETASAAHIYGKNLVHMEAFTSNNHWQEGPQDLKLSADRAFAEGMNHVVWHTAAHQPPDSGKPGWVYGAGTHLNQNVPWWPMAKPFLDYLVRVSYLLQQGRFVADVLYYYGDGGYRFVPPKHVDPSLGFGFDYDVTNAEVLRRLEVRAGKLILPHGMEYEILVLPERSDIDPGALEKIASLVERGAAVVGPKPDSASGYSVTPGRDAAVRTLADRVWGACDGREVLEHRYGSGKVFCGRALREVLAERGVGPDFSFISRQPGTALDFVHRSSQDAEIYFVRNLRNRLETVDAEFRVRGKAPELWDAATGSIRKVDLFETTSSGVRLTLQLEPEDSVFVVLRRSAFEPQRTTPAPPRTSAALEIVGPWTVRFPPNWGAPDSILMDRLISWTDYPEPGVRYFSGTAEYRAGFDVPASWLHAAPSPRVDLGSLWAVAEVTLNGKPLGVAWTPPFRLAARTALRSGHNELIVRVANNWVNRLVGDARGGGPKYTRTNVTVTDVPARPWSKVDLKPSGLFGPVRLLAD